MRRAAKRDRSEALIVSALRAAGCSVDFWGVDGAPDLVVGRDGKTWLLEVKQPIGKRGGTGRDGQHLGDRQLAWHRAWRGHVDVVRTPAEALLAVGITTQGEST